MPNIKPIYLDYAASTPVFKDVVEELLPFFTHNFGNPSNVINEMGDITSEAVTKAKGQIIDLLQASNYELVFTSGATESVNMILKGLVQQNEREKSQIITCETEHKAVLSVCEYLETLGVDVIYLPVDKKGRFSFEELENNITLNTLAVVLMAVNNETGVQYEIDKIAELCDQRNVNFVCDATQAVGKIKINLNKTLPDYFVFSGHKMYAPKGIGGVLIRKDKQITPHIHGGGQQESLRAGTLNVPGIVALGKASEILAKNQASEFQRISQLQQKFEDKLFSTGKVEVVGRNSNRSPYISNIQFLENDAEEIIFPLRNKLFFSTGSACTSQIVEPSHVLKAMGLNNNEAENCLRFSFGKQTTNEEIDNAINLILNLIT